MGSVQRVVMASFLMSFHAARTMGDKVAAKSSNPLEDLVTRLKPDKMSGRMMKYPYTFTAKIAQFPLQHYMKHSWVFKYYGIGVGLCIPVFMWIQKLSNSPENVAKFEAKKKAEH